MLRIEKVFLQGFKSFSDPTEVVFDEEGITGIVGPNGCGKSNLSEAISWVIGEQRARALRGGKMEDVIFQGSRNRSASGLAEVLLTMVVRAAFEVRTDAGSEVDLPPEPVVPSVVVPESDSNFPATEEPPKRRRRLPPATRVYEEGERITVGRRLYRTGESEYEMNGRACRLRDVQDLFAGTGLGGAHYAIIEQGRIGQVLSAKPLDRRALIEEAAGVSKFKMRQHAAELKLEASRLNLSRLTDIILEIERQQNSLKRQASKARRYQRLREEMRHLMRLVFVADYRAERDALTTLDEKWNDISLRETGIAEKLASLEAEHRLAVQTGSEREQRLNQSRQVAGDVDVEAERARLEHAHLGEQLQSMLARSAEQEREGNQIVLRGGFIDDETARLRSELEELESEINEHAATLAADEQTHKYLLTRDREAEETLELSRQKLYEATTSLERCRQLARQLEESSDRSALRLNGLNAELERTETQSRETEERRGSLASNTAELEKTYGQISSALGATNSILANLREQRGSVAALQASAREELSRIEHRLKSLVELDDRHAYFSEPVQMLLNRAAGGDFRVLGTLADFVHAAPENEAMIEAVLHEELEYLIVPSYEDALYGIEILKGEGGGRGTFMCVGLHGADHTSPIIDRESEQENDGGLTLLDLLNLRPEFSMTFERAFPLLARAQVFENASDAIAAGDPRNAENRICVTRAGERIVGNHVISGGRTFERGVGVLGLKREIGELTDRFGEASTTVSDFEIQLKQLDTNLASLDAQREALGEQLRVEEKELAVLREQSQQADRDAERIATHIRIIIQEKSQVEAEVTELEARVAEARSQTGEAETVQRDAEAAVTSSQSEVVEMRKAAEARIEEIAGRRAELAAQSERRRGLENTISRLKTEAIELTERLERTRFEAIEASERITTLQSEIVERAKQIEDHAARQAILAGRIEEESLSLSECRQQLEAIDSDLRAGREAAQTAREERAQIELERVRLSSSLEHLAESCQHELNESIHDLLNREFLSQVSQGAPIDSDDRDESDDDLEEWAFPESFDLSDAKSRLEALRDSIENLGPINMMALEELTEVRERFQFLVGQKTDIENAVADTQAAIAEIKRRSRERFQDAFREININFSAMFQELFGGGRGEMRLIDETDILESGIEIIAQPPGKRLQNVLLLSGGEKAMTAIALVLSIFKYRPSPFCILDEVDAPLDEVNIGRFVDKVVEMSDSTQFMIVTHAKRTMEAARALYGVTMEDPGVSKLISVRLT